MFTSKIILYCVSASGTLGALSEWNFMKQLFKRILPGWAKDIMRPVLKRYWHRHKMRNSWISRKDTLEDNHLATYWNASGQPNRILLIEILSDCLHSDPSSISKGVLEYGSHVGLNLKLLNEKLQNPKIHYYAVEPNLDAFQFLKSKLTFVNALNAEDEGFCRSDFPMSNVRLSFVNSVFFCMSSSRAKAVLTKLSKISEIIVIGDAMENLDGSKSKFRSDPACHQHPYKNWLFELGFKNITHVPVPDPRPQLNGYIIAKRSE